MGVGRVEGGWGGGVGVRERGPEPLGVLGFPGSSRAPPRLLHAPPRSSLRSPDSGSRVPAPLTEGGNTHGTAAEPEEEEEGVGGGRWLAEML